MEPVSEIFNGDCMEYMARFPNGFFDLAVVDPEYGIGEDGRKTKGRALRKDGSFVPRKDKRNGAPIKVMPSNYAVKKWDSKPPAPEYFAELRRVSKNQIIWGGNYFSLPPSPCWIVWDKVNGDCDFADCELAWTSFKGAVRQFTFMWSGFKQAASAKAGHIMQGNMAKREIRIHPTQKPVALYEWILRNYAKPGDKILDTHLGSQSSRIAAYKLGFDFWGCEIDDDYIREGNARFEKEIAMPLFDAPKPVIQNQLNFKTL